MAMNVHCACGAVEVEVSGQPVFQAFCHCKDCRDWLGAPVHAATVWPADQVDIIRGADDLITYKRSEKSLRKSCGSCGSAVLVDHPEVGMVDIMASRLDGFAFVPSMHVYYGEHMIEMRDELPKFVNLPAEFGGDGTTV